MAVATRVLITGGPTRAYLDAVRFLTNESTGRLGVELAAAALSRGWDVHYLRGRGSAAPQSVLDPAAGGLTVEEIETVDELLAAVRREVGGRRYDAVIHGMAVLDFVPAKVRPGKTSSREEWHVRLVPSPKVIALVKDLDPDVFLVGFKLEAGVDEAALLAAARASLAANRAGLVVANTLESVRAGVHEAYLVPADGSPPERVVGKAAVARRVIERVADALAARGAPPGEGAPPAPVEPFAGRTVLVAVPAGIAAYKVAGLVRRLRRAGARVRVAMTPNATRLVGTATFEALSGHPVLADLFAPGAALEHVRWADAADAALVAPATADVIGRLAAGVADDAVTTVLLALGTRAPVVVAPAMNAHMWDNPVVQRNVRTLRDLGYRFAGPERGPLAEGYEGVGRLADEDAILAVLAAALEERPSPPRTRPCRS